MAEYDVLVFAARILKYDYPATEYRTRHPELPQLR